MLVNVNGQDMVAIVEDTKCKYITLTEHVGTNRFKTVEFEHLHNSWLPMVEACLWPSNGNLIDFFTECTGLRPGTHGWRVYTFLREFRSKYPSAKWSEIQNKE